MLRDITVLGRKTVSIFDLSYALLITALFTISISVAPGNAKWLNTVITFGNRELQFCKQRISPSKIVTRCDFEPKRDQNFWGTSRVVQRNRVVNHWAKRRAANAN